MNILHLEPAQKARAAAALTRAFAEDPLYRHIFPDPAEARRSLNRLWDAILACSLKYGEVYTTAAVNGAACWLSPGQTEMTLWRMLNTGLALPRAVMAFSPQARQRMMTFVDYTEKLHAPLKQRPHWYLWLLGVAPEAQGQGLGSRLIQPVLARADAAGLPCYLETETESNVHFYERRGFAVVHSGEVPGQGVRLWTMLREPRPVAAR